MTKKKDRPVPGVKRRSVLRGLATGLAGAVVAPSATSPAGAAESSPPSLRQAQPPTDVGSTLLLSEHERPTLVSLCELLVPGSVDAGVPDLVERAAAVDAPEARKAFLAAVRAFEGEARSVHRSRWVDLDKDAQVAILNGAVTGSRSILEDHLVHLRDAVAHAYFATEPGMLRLGWTRRSAWRELPACNHPDDNHR